MLKKSILILSLLLFSQTVSALTIALDKPLIAYDEPNTTSNKIRLLIAEPVDILQEVGDYYKATSKTQNSLVFYIPKSDLPGNILPQMTAGMDIVTTALNYLGAPYIYGGNSLETGVDCSSFVQLIYAKHNIALNRTSRDQFFNNGSFITELELRPGDLIFYGQTSDVSGSTEYNIQHLGIYIGDGKMIHASTSIRGVVIDNYRASGFPPLIGFKRILP